MNLYTKVTDQILSQLEHGTVPWVKPWSATAGRNTPCNAVSNRPYSGINTVLLWTTAVHGFPAPRFLTFGQAKRLGGTVRRGEHGFKIYFVKRMDIKSKPESESIDDTLKTITLLREYTVFNVSQCENLPEEIVNPSPPRVFNPDIRFGLADEFLRITGADIREGHGEAYYAPGKDFISLPSWQSFYSQHAFYNTAFHELGHWTGHKTRLDRDLKSRFGEQRYAAEELVAELCAAFLCSEFGFDTTVRSASYINSWISLFRNDNRAFFTAASKASKAADYLRHLALQDQEQQWPSTFHPTSIDLQPTPLPVATRYS